eukprot:jgi/Antlo1/1619/1831
MEDEMKAAVISSEYTEQIREIRHHVERKCGHFVLCYMDEWVLAAIFSHLENVVGKHFVEIRNSGAAFHRQHTDAVFVARIDKLKGSKQQAAVYTLLESSMKDINLVLLTHSCMTIDSLERRIRSRLNHRIVFLPYLSTAAASMLLGGAQPPPVPSCNAILREHLIRKHRIAKYELYDLYRILSPLHLALMILCASKRIRHTNVVEEFRKFTTKCRELRNTPSTNILCSYFDIMDSGAMDNCNRFLFDIEELKFFIRKEAPFYIRSLLK